MTLLKVFLLRTPSLPASDAYDRILNRWLSTATFPRARWSGNVYQLFSAARLRRELREKQTARCCAFHHPVVIYYSNIWSSQGPKCNLWYILQDIRTWLHHYITTWVDHHYKVALFRGFAGCIWMNIDFLKALSGAHFAAFFAHWLIIAAWWMHWIAFMYGLIGYMDGCFVTCPHQCTDDSNRWHGETILCVDAIHKPM